MQTVQYLTEILKELERAPEVVSSEEAERLASAIMEAGQIFVAGAGRSGFVVKSIAMRLMHIGLNSHVIGETVTPGIGHGDLLLIGSGSGETKSLAAMADKAKSLGASVALLTTAPQSYIGSSADIVVKLPGSQKDPASAHYETIQPMGSLFEQSMLLFGDAIVLRIMEQTKQTTESMYGKHANLE
ncbi:6-phospho-3-hexuloisomerase [Paenibacillus sp. P96]|uniref:6-phospho-3-hexuloisomerase n=1 Tax=Paenibacillus zeirhizosphaerae TaxID=2987519 RepID=A0ABT9FP12_9BACL|nr:6-phospho-3-hexuloisomerase [Paenibacillus sp. P96]MDP4096251.1 6-phospho-3-hexuloisomerase [Paenibacillus sp. P96]